jgi:His/Glu/Gln/Arg/opine family amino acid ABC transporter permease subunit
VDAVNVTGNAVISNLGLFGEGLKITLIISASSIPLAILLGTVIALFRLSKITVLRSFAMVYLEIFRNIPFTIQVFLLYYLLPFYDIRLPSYGVGIFGLSLYTSAYFSEIVRSAINALPAGQLEASGAIGMTRFQTLRYIVFPQLPPYIIPPFINQSASLVKDTAILSTITVHELTMVAQRVQNETYSFTEPLLFAALLYLCINGTLIFLMSKVKVYLEPRKLIAS